MASPFRIFCLNRSKLTGTSPDLEVLGRFLTTARHNLIFYHLPLIEGPQARTFDSRDVDEYILAPGFRLDEPVTLSRIESLHGALSHLSSPDCRWRSLHRYLPSPKPDTIDVREDVDKVRLSCTLIAQIALGVFIGGDALALLATGFLNSRQKK
jgi:hypothetical protein